MLALGSARAEESCALAPAPPGRLASADEAGDYQSVLRLCRGAGGERIAIRSLKLRGERVLLLADPGTLATRLERASCWSCEDVDESRLAGTRMMRAVERSAEAPGVAHRGFLENAGLVHGAAAGTFVTGDLCPSNKPLDRAFLDRLAGERPGAPIALSISGLWLTRHFADFSWLLRRQAEGAFDITWVNHSYRHPFKKSAPDDRNYLLAPGVDPDDEILRTERLLIANGQVPSLFFRFPGLVSSAPLMQATRRHHLIALGADAWLALNQRPRSGSIVLVHPNGNEELGLRMFDADMAKGRFAEPLEPLANAPL